MKSRFEAYICVVALTACGGGGGSTPGTPTGVSVPPPITTNLSQQSVQRADAQSALTGVQAYDEYAGNGSISTLTAVRAMHRMLSKANPRHPMTCSNGPGVNESIVNNGNGTLTATIEDYYDSLCTEPEAKIVWTVSQSGNNLTGPASFTQYSISGAVTGTANATITFYYNGSSASATLTGFSFLLTNVTQNGTALGDVGLACSVNANGASSACGIAAAANVPSISAMDGASVSLSVATSSVSMQITAYQGSENSLTIAQGAFPDWTISPSSDQIANVSLAGTSTSTGYALTLTDNTNGGTFAITGSSNGNVTGTLTNNSSGVTVASFTVNAQGNGTLTYSNGTQVQIVDYVVQG